MQGFPHAGIIEGVSEPDPDSETVVFSEVAIHLSARHFPVLIVTWFGVPIPAVIEGFAGWLDRMSERAAAEGTKLVILGDTTGMTSQPGPDVRRAIAAGIERVLAEHPGRLIGVTTIIGPPMMRAVITMVLAITRHKLNWKPVKDMPQAIARSFALLDEAKVPRPAGLDASSYIRPARPR
jgi:hypothetical protein